MLPHAFLSRKTTIFVTSVVSRLWAVKRSKSFQPETPKFKDPRLHGVFLTEGILEFYPVFERVEMDLPSFVRCKKEDIERLNISNPQEQEKLLDAIQRTKNKYNKETAEGSNIRENRLDELSRILWDYGKLPATELPKIIHKPQHPLILCHGIGGSKPLIPYFHSIVEDLEEGGCKAARWPVEKYSSIATRATSLQKSIEWYLTNNPDVKKVNLIAHSMGGLDCRYYISCLGGHRYTASLTTIGTPHLGSSWANFILSWVDVQDWLPIVPEGYRNLTPKYLIETFNPKVIDHPDVKYFCVVGAVEKMSPLDVFYVPYSYIKAWEGDNDGLVSVTSQTWGEVIERVPLSHNQQHFSKEARHLYRRVANFLGKENF